MTDCEGSTLGLLTHFFRVAVEEVEDLHINHRGPRHENPHHSGEEVEVDAQTYPWIRHLATPGLQIIGNM